MTNEYKKEIDGLRAFAVLSVVFYHLFPDTFRGGYIGVDIFFVISGFLITRNIFQSLDNNNFNIYSFFGRRIRRIFPTLILVFVSSLIFGFFILFNNEYTQLNKHIASSSGFMINFILNNESGYFDLDSIRKPMLHLWSLAVEEQFYIIWPFVLLFMWKKNFNLLWITLIVALISFYYNIKLSETNPTKNFFLPLGRFWEFLIGSMLAWFFVFKKIKIFSFNKVKNNNLTISKNRSYSPYLELITSNLFSFLGISFLIFSIFTINEKLIFQSLWVLVPIIGTCLIIIAGHKSFLNRALLMNPISTWFGLISYPLYLWHWPILSLSYIAFDESENINYKIFCLFISVILSWITYKFLEKPIRNNKHKNLKTLVLCNLIILIFLISFINYTTKSKILPYTPKQSVAVTAAYSPLRKECHFSKSRSSVNKQACKYFGNNIKVSILGNSHGVELAYAIAEELKNADIGLVHHTISGCESNYGLREKIPNIYKDHPKKIHKIKKAIVCADWHSSVVNSILSNENIDTVIVSYRNDWFLNDEIYSSAMNKMLSDLSKYKKNVILVLQAPFIKQTDNLGKKMLINDYIRKYVFLPKSNIKYFPLNDWKTKYDVRNKLLNKLNEKIRIYDPADKFCDDVNCFIIRNGIALYADNDHMSINGARLIAKDIINLIK